MSPYVVTIINFSPSFTSWSLNYIRNIDVHVKASLQFSRRIRWILRQIALIGLPVRALASLDTCRCAGFLGGRYEIALQR